MLSILRIQPASSVELHTKLWQLISKVDYWFLAERRTWKENTSRNTTLLFSAKPRSYTLEITDKWDPIQEAHTTQINNTQDENTKEKHLSVSSDAVAEQGKINYITSGNRRVRLHKASRSYFCIEIRLQYADCYWLGSSEEPQRQVGGGSKIPFGRSIKLQWCNSGAWREVKFFHKDGFSVIKEGAPDTLTRQDSITALPHQPDSE